MAAEHKQNVENVKGEGDTTLSGDSGSNVEPCPLLEIPPEVRNTIYDLALVDHFVMEIPPHHCSQPALLQKCRQIREEAAPMFFHENEFSLEAYNFRMEPQPHHWIWTKAAVKRIHFCSQYERTKFSDLLLWLEKCHAGHFPENTISTDWEDYAATMDGIMFDAFATAASLRHVPWKDVKNVLIRFARSLSAVSKDMTDTDGYWGDVE